MRDCRVACRAGWDAPGWGSKSRGCSAEPEATDCAAEFTRLRQTPLSSLANDVNDVDDVTPAVGRSTG
jgi:hypothetical protein